MDSTVPADLLKLKTRLEAWRSTRRYARQPIQDEFRQAAAEITERRAVRRVRQSRVFHKSTQADITR